MTPTPAPRDEREAFEAAFKDMFYVACFERNGSDEYVGRGLQGAWLGWKARAALAEAEMAKMRPYIGANARKGIQLQIAEELIDGHPHERTSGDFEYECALHDKIAALLAERDELRAELERVKAIQPSQWSDGLILDFLCIALRNVDLQGEVRLSEIRQGFEHVARLAAIDASRDAGGGGV